MKTHLITKEKLVSLLNGKTIDSVNIDDSQIVLRFTNGESCELHANVMRGLMDGFAFIIMAIS